jgi:hypothetical protein
MEESADEEVEFRPKVVNAVLKKKKTAPPPMPPKRMSSLGAIKIYKGVAAEHTHTVESHQPGTTLFIIHKTFEKILLKIIFK